MHLGTFPVALIKYADKSSPKEKGRKKRKEGGQKCWSTWAHSLKATFWCQALEGVMNAAAQHFSYYSVWGPNLKESYHPHLGRVFLSQFNQDKPSLASKETCFLSDSKSCSQYKPSHLQ